MVPHYTLRYTEYFVLAQTLDTESDLTDVFKEKTGYMT